MQSTPTKPSKRLALTATLHCLSGFAVGEVLGLTVGGFSG